MTDPSRAREATSATAPEHAAPDAASGPGRDTAPVPRAEPAVRATVPAWLPLATSDGTAFHEVADPVQAGPAVPAGPPPPPPIGPSAAGAPGAIAGPPAADAPPVARAALRKHRGRTIRRRVAVALLVLALAATTAAAAHLYRTTRAWQDRSDDYLVASQGLGTELAASRADLAGSRAELDAVRAQLATAQTRIVELADEKAQLGDDREVQEQLVGYQERVTEAAGRVALALDQCVQGQDQLIDYLQHADQYDPAELERYGTDVQTLCQTATDANTALQRELDR